MIGILDEMKMHRILLYEMVFFVSFLFLLFFVVVAAAAAEH